MSIKFVLSLKGTLLPVFVIDLGHWNGLESFYRYNKYFLLACYFIYFNIKPCLELPEPC